MDPAKEIELKYLEYQKPMNDVIDRGDSPVQLFYQDATVFLTGGSGFLGKQLIEKLFRSCAIKKIYLLLRPKKGSTIQARLQNILSDPVYDVVRKKKPQFADSIIPVEGNVSDVRLGLSDNDWNMLAQEVDTIFHAAATINFEAPLHEATMTNVRGTREVITLAKECVNLKNFVHVSTAYANATKDRIGDEVFEKFYPTPVAPDILITLAETDENRLNSISKNFIEGRPNTYTFTKAVTEDLIRTSAKDLPVCIVRPPIVVSSFCEPMPGWVDVPAAMLGPCGILLGIIMGVIHVVYYKKYVMLAATPVDYVNNAIIGAGWDAGERRKNGETEIPIYSVTNKDNGFDMNTFHTLRGEEKLATDKAVYLCSVIDTRYKLVYYLLAALFHYIPAYIADTLCTIIGKRPKQIKSFAGMYKILDKLAGVYEYFTLNEWQFRNDNLVAMMNRMTDADRAIYNCDLSKIDFKEFILVLGLGVRKYVIKDGLNNSALGHKKQIIFRFVNYIILPLYVYLIWTVLYFIYNSVKYLLYFVLNI